MKSAHFGYTQCKRGFTLVELLVVISIIAILSIIGMVIFTGVQKNARDAKRRADIDAIVKAVEVNYGRFTPGKYPRLCQVSPTPTYDCNQWFSGSLPKDPSNTGDYRYCWSYGVTPCNPSTTYLDLTTNPPIGPDSDILFVFCAKLETTSNSFCMKTVQ